MGEPEILDYLQTHNISFVRVEHPPVMTCEEADRERPDLPGAHLKNLFLRDKARKHVYLLVTRCGKRVNTRDLGSQLGVRKLHFGSAEDMQELLGLSPGAVSILGLVHDPAGMVELLIDKDIWMEQAYLCHPLVNTATLLIQRSNMLRFIELTGHTARVLDIPGMDG